MVRRVLLTGLLAMACPAPGGGDGDGDVDSDTDTSTNTNTGEPCSCELPGGGEGMDCRCNGNCVDLQTNARNCGACFLNCDVENGRSNACVGGSCVCGAAETCAGGIESWCCETEGVGACVSLLTEEANCGACGVVCESPESNLCRQGVCVCGTPEPGEDAAPCGAGMECCGEGGDAVCVDLGDCP